MVLFFLIVRIGGIFFRKLYWLYGFFSKIVRIVRIERISSENVRIFVRIFSKNVWATLHMVQYVALTRLTYDRGQFSLHSPVRGLIMTTPMARSDFLQYPA